MAIESDFFSKINERPLKQHEKLRELLIEASFTISAEAASEYGPEEGLADLLLPDGTIRMDNFDSGNGGMYDSELIVDDKKYISGKETEWFGTNNPNTIKHFKDEHECDTPEKIIAYRKKVKETGKSGMFEQAMLVLLHKFLKEKFLVVRTAVFDDYKAGADNLIINKETGDVICAFDEVHDSKVGEYTKEKLEKVKKIAMKGGTNIRYGLTLEDGKIKQIGISNVPVFAISLDSKKFEKLLPVLLENGLNKRSGIEEEVMTELVRSLGEQAEMLRKLKINKHTEKVRANLGMFDSSYGRMRELVGAE